MITFKLKEKRFSVRRNGKKIFAVTEGTAIAEVANIEAN